MIEHVFIVLAIAVQLSDAAQTCRAVSRGAVELNPLLGQRPSCAKVVLVKGAGLSLIPIARKGRWRNTMIAANIGSGGVGISLTLYLRRQK